MNEAGSILRSGASDRSAPKVQSEVDNGLTQIKGNLENLHGMIDALASRLNPILSPAADNQKAKPEPVANSMMGKQLYDLANSSNESVRRIEDLLNRICL